MRRRIAFSSVIVCAALAACGESTSLSGPDASAPASLKRDGLQVAATQKRLLVTGLEELQGSTVGPGRALFVTAPLTGSIWRIDPKTGARSLFASGLPPRIPTLFYIGAGVVDVAFIGSTAYALVTGVNEDIGGGHDIVGIYRIDGPNSSTVVADIGAWSIAHPPKPAFFAPTGFQYAIVSFRDGFIVTDAHHNRVLRVSPHGDISEVIAFEDLVPTGLAVSGNSIYLAQAGPIPHLPQTGKVVTFGLGSSMATDVASGIRLAVDVEFGRGHTLFALSQGFWDGPFEGTPANPNTGTLFRVHGNGPLTTIADGLDRPTSVEIIENTAYVVTLGGEVWTVPDIATPPYGL
jgi:hypothetical protein